jgi:hypothetical protein
MNLHLWDPRRSREVPLPTICSIRRPRISSGCRCYVGHRLQRSAFYCLMRDVHGEPCAKYSYSYTYKKVNNHPCCGYPPGDMVLHGHPRTDQGRRCLKGKTRAPGNIKRTPYYFVQVLRIEGSGCIYLSLEFFFSPWEEIPVLLFSLSRLYSCLILAGFCPFDRMCRKSSVSIPAHRRIFLSSPAGCRLLPERKPNQPLSIAACLPTLLSRGN